MNLGRRIEELAAELAVYQQPTDAERALVELARTFQALPALPPGMDVYSYGIWFRRLDGQTWKIDTTGITLQEKKGTPQEFLRDIMEAYSRAIKRRQDPEHQAEIRHSAGQLRAVMSGLPK